MNFRLTLQFSDRLRTIELNVRIYVPQTMYVKYSYVCQMVQKLAFDTTKMKILHIEKHEL